ncbi:MAG: hypothetical protein K8U03_04830 [Planctomycetia bacterium]|nr:hypothetical protein [Planctomycetia bacterium]
MTLTRRNVFCFALALFAAVPLFAAEEPKVVQSKVAESVPGQRVFSAGHSFHYFIPPILAEIAESASIVGHRRVGEQPIGGSRVIKHWEVTGEKSTLKPALATGEVDVLTLAPIYLPDEGIDLVAEYALKHNPKMRNLIQEFWLPFDEVAIWYKKALTVDQHDTKTIAELRKEHEPYFAGMDAHVQELNKKYGKQALFVVPVGQAVLALREKILAGQAPGLKLQSELFIDPAGHPNVQIKVLNSYCHFAVIYRRSPVGLPVPKLLTTAKQEKIEELNKLLQQLAWDAVKAHTLSGIEQKTAGSE